MDVLPEVLRVAISEALTSGKKLSWSVWDNGEITSVKLLWKPDVSSPVRSEIPPRPVAPSILHLRSRHNVKKKRSPSSWRRSNQRLKSFLEKKSSQERQERGTVVIGESQEFPATPINAPQPPPSSQSDGDRMDADSNSEDRALKGGREPIQATAVDSVDEKDDRSLDEVLQGSHNILYEAKDDATGVSFEKNGVKEWLPIVVTKKGKELSVKELERCKRIVYFQNENGPHFSIRKGNCQFPTPIARRTRSWIKSEAS